MLWRLAWRNLWRSRRRTLITLASIMFGLLLSITFTSMSDGSYSKLIDSAARAGLGHVTLQPQGFRDRPGNNLYLKEINSLVEAVRADEDVETAQVRVFGQAMVATAADTAGVAFAAIDPQAEGESFNLFDHIKEGRAVQSMVKGEAVIGRRLAETLELKLGSKLVLTTTDKDGEVVSGLLRVRGIFETGIDEADRYQIAVPLGWARNLIGFSDDEATLIAVTVHDQRRAERIAARLGALSGPHSGEGLPWFKVMPDFAGMIAIDNASNYLFQMIIMLLVAAGIFNTVLMSVMERMREMGVMMAVGMTARRLFWMVTIETFWLAVVGILAGLLVSAPVYYYMATVGLDFTETLKEQQNFGGVAWDPIMTSSLYPDHLAIILVAVFALVMLAGLYPAVIASKTKPLRALRMQ